MKYIHQLEDWPDFQWDSERLIPLLAESRPQEKEVITAMLTNLIGS